MQVLVRIVVAFAFVFFGMKASPSNAAVITYTLTGTAGGSYAGKPFSGPIVMTAEANTSTRQFCISSTGPIPECYAVNNTKFFINIPELGAFKLVNPTYSLVDYRYGIFDFGEIIFGTSVEFRDIMAANFPASFQDPRLSNYDLISNLGPINTTSLVFRKLVPGTSTLVPFVTDRGALTLAGGSLSASTFTAVLATSAVPESSTWMTMIFGFFLAGFIMRAAKVQRIAGSSH